MRTVTRKNKKKVIMIIYIIENVYLFFRIFVFPMFVFFPRKCIKGDENCNPKLIRTVMKKIVIMIFLLDKNRILIFSFFVFVFSFQRFFIIIIILHLSSFTDSGDIFQAREFMGEVYQQFIRK